MTPNPLSELITTIVVEALYQQVLEDLGLPDSPSLRVTFTLIAPRLLTFEDPRELLPEIYASLGHMPEGAEVGDVEQVLVDKDIPQGNVVLPTTPEIN